MLEGYIYPSMYPKNIYPSMLVLKTGFHLPPGVGFAQDQAPACRVGSHVTAGAFLSSSKISCSVPADHHGNFSVKPCHSQP